MINEPTIEPGESEVEADEEGPDEEVVTLDGVVRPRERENTEPREHAYLRQTVPPLDPMVREVEQRRSGKKSK